MEDSKITLPQERNPVTHLRHRREVFWQITLPIVLGIIVILLLAFLVTRIGVDQASVWADISLIWLIVPVMIVTLISLVFLAASIYLNVRVLQVLPFYSRLVQEWFASLSVQVGRFNNVAVEPVMRIQALKASIGSLGRNVRRK